MSRRRNTVPKRQAFPRVRCSCGVFPRFGSVQLADGKVHSFYACPAAPRGCGKAAPEHVDDFADQVEAARLWDRMRKEEAA